MPELGTKTTAGETVEMKIAARYSADPSSIPTYFANVIHTIGTPEEIYLDVCQVQPQTLNTETGTAAATVIARVIITRQHAQRLMKSLETTLKSPLELRGSDKA